MTLTLTLRKRILLLACLFVVGFFIVNVVTLLLVAKIGMTTPVMRIVTILQDILMFIVPPVVTALLVTRMPATLLCVDNKPDTVSTIMAMFVLIASIPAMNMVIWLNENMPLPHDLAVALTEMEQNAAASIEAMNGPHDIPNLIVSILIIGIFAGLSEELLFRGGLQRLLTTGGVNHHTAIWISAAVFSALHMQFYGFVPRMLLGAFFGYALWWTRSLWVPIILHAFNNTVYLIGQFLSYGNEETSALDSVGHGSDYLLVVGSVVLVVLGLWIVRRNALVDHAHQGRAD